VTGRDDTDAAREASGAGASHSPQEIVMSTQDTLFNGSRATLRAEGAELLVEVLGFEFPDATVDFSARWLLARVTWRGAGGWLQCEGPLFTVEELAAWGHAAMAQDDGVSVNFVEPNVQFACVSRDEGDMPVVRVGLLQEAKSGNTHLDTRMRASREDLGAFGLALVEMARALARAVSPSTMNGRIRDRRGEGAGARGGVGVP
jgi:hypothetical protein